MPVQERMGNSQVILRHLGGAPHLRQDPRDTWLSGLRVPSRSLGQVARPIVHQPAPALEQGGSGIGGLNPVPDHMRQCRLWGSRRWRRIGEYSTEIRLFIWMVHTIGNHNVSLSEGKVLAVVVGEFPETPHQTRDNTDFSRLMRQSEARLRIACPPRAARRRAASEGEMVVGATPEFWPLMRHGAGAGYSGLYSSFSPASWGRSHHRDPWREGRNAENPDPGSPAQPGLTRARSPCWTWCGQPIPLARYRAQSAIRTRRRSNRSERA